MSNRNNQIIAGIVAVLAILVIWWLATNRDQFPTGSGNVTSTPSTSTGTTPPSTPPTTGGTGTVTPPTASPTTSPSGESVTVSNQAAGSMVALGSVNVTKSTWVVVRDSKDWILGAARFDASVSSGQIQLLRNTVSGETYTVAFYADDGDRMFDMKKDMMVSGEGAASATFTAQ